MAKHSKPGSWKPRGPGLWLSLLLVTGLVYCSPQPSGSSAQKQTAEQTPARTNYDRQWVEQKAVPISIPEGSGGQAELKRNFYFIMDGSGSMRERTSRNCGGDQQFRDKINGARWAIKKFLEHFPGDVNIGLYVFDRNGSREIVPLARTTGPHSCRPLTKSMPGAVHLWPGPFVSAPTG
jgi:hypothetical protein